MTIKENINFDDLSKEELEGLHTEVHVLFNMVLSGTIKDWTFQKLYNLHKVIFNALIRAGGQHVAPIDQLDNIQMLEETATLKDLEYLNQKEKNIIAKIIAVSKIDKEFYYHCAVEGNTFIGKTFNTNILAKTGEKLEIAFINLNQYTDKRANKLWFNFYSPRVISKTNKQITSLAEVKKLVQKTDGEIKVKEFPTISKEDLQEILSDDGKVYSRAELKIKNNSVKKEQLAEKKELKFKLKHNFAKNKFIIKDLAVENWSVEFKNKSWSLNKNLALEEKGIIGINQKSDKLGKIIDEGVCEIVEELENSIYVKFKGKELKGYWNFKKKDSVWNITKDDNSTNNLNGREFGSPMSQEEIRRIYFLTQNNIGVSEIGRLLNRPNATIYEWKKKLSI
jgi:hypothetical protein